MQSNNTATTLPQTAIQSYFELILGIFSKHKSLIYKGVNLVPTGSNPAVPTNFPFIFSKLRLGSEKATTALPQLTFPSRFARKAQESQSCSALPPVSLFFNNLGYFHPLKKRPFRPFAAPYKSIGYAGLVRALPARTTARVLGGCA